MTPAAEQALAGAPESFAVCDKCGAPVVVLESGLIYCPSCDPQLAPRSTPDTDHWGYRMGRADRRCGLVLDDCPFLAASDAALAWRAGWHSRDTHQREEATMSDTPAPPQRRSHLQLVASGEPVPQAPAALPQVTADPFGFVSVARLQTGMVHIAIENAATHVDILAHLASHCGELLPRQWVLDKLAQTSAEIRRLKLGQFADVPTDGGAA